MIRAECRSSEQMRVQPREKKLRGAAIRNRRQEAFHSADVSAEPRVIREEAGGAGAVF